MAQQNEKNSLLIRIKRLFSGLTSLVLTLVLVAVIYVAAVLLHASDGNEQNAWVVEEEENAVTPLQAASSSDVQSLARLFGAPLPAYSSQAPSGEARNTRHDGQAVRQITLSYPGLIITAVRPASAAPLLLRDELIVQSRSDLTVMNLPAVLAGKGTRHCLYFSSEFAAYSVYAPNATEEEFLAAVSRITQVR